MSDTPRTDAQTMQDEYDHVDTEFGAFAPSITVSADFARQLERELAEANRVIQTCLSVMPVGYIPSHTPENLPSKIEGLVKELAESTVINERLERELAEALEWKQYLSSWGGTPEIVFSFIQGQQARIRAAQEVEKQRDLLIEGLEKLASCDWVITLPDRMDAVREIARQTIEIVKKNKITP